MLGSALLLFIAVLGASYWAGSKPKYVPLFTEMESKDAGDVVAKLQELKIPYEIMGNGTAIGVSEKDQRSFYGLRGFCREIPGAAS